MARQGLCPLDFYGLDTCARFTIAEGRIPVQEAARLAGERSTVRVCEHDARGDPCGLFARP